jgi:hypothetical protein
LAAVPAIVTDDGVAGELDPPPPHPASANAAQSAAEAERIEGVVRRFMSPSRMRCRG